MISIKEDLRKEVKKRRKEVLNKELLDEIIKNKLLNNKMVINSQDILVYISMELEVDTFNLINELFKLKKNLYAPRIEGDVIKFYKFNSLDELKINKFKILEPTSNIEIKSYRNCLIIVPGLLFDKNNNRLGYGGGFYDKFLSNKSIYKIGICYSCFLVDNLTVDNHDIKMDEVITDGGRDGICKI